MTFSSDEPNDDAAALLPAESPAQAAAARLLRVWTVFAVFFATVVACTVVQIPVVIVLVVIKVAGGASQQDGLDAIATPWGFIAIAIPAQLVILTAWWLATSFGDPRAAALANN